MVATLTSDESKATLSHSPMHRFPFKVSYLLDIPIASLNYQQILGYLEQQIHLRQKTFCVTLNLDILRLAYEVKGFHSVIKKADFVFADGMPIIWLSWLKTGNTVRTAPLPERIPGCDIVQDLCHLSHEKGYTIFILGAASGVAEVAKAKLEEKLPNIQVVGTYAPASEELKDLQKSKAILENINATNADILFVALGAPKQETWIANHIDQLTPFVIVPCGGSIDFIAGTQKKSPSWIGRLGFEWLYRLAHNPGRLFHRYILNDLPFLLKAGCSRKILRSDNL